MVKKMFSLLVFSAAMLLVLFSGCTDTENPGANLSIATEDITSTVTPVSTETPDTADPNAVAEVGDTVYVQYVGTFDNGTVFDESEAGDPLVFTLGNKSMITGFEDAVYGMKVGEKKSIHLTPDQAYGEYKSDYVFNISKAMISNDTEIYKGDSLILQSSDGSLFQVIIVDILTDTYIVDANSPMAGKELNFEINLEKIEKSG